MLSALVSLVLVAAPANPGSLPPTPAPLVAPPEASLGSEATLALEHDGRVDGAVLVSEIGLAITTAQALAHLSGSLVAALHDGRRLPARVVAVDPAHDLGLVLLEGPGPFPALALAASVPPPGAPLVAIVQPGALAWQSIPCVLLQPYAAHQGRVETERIRVRVASPLLGEGGPVLDEGDGLVGVITAPQPGQPPAEALAIPPEVVRSFLDRAAVYAPTLTLQLSSTPPDAAVSIDGRPVGKTGAAPLQLERLTLGRHEVRLSLPGAADDLFAVELLRHAVQRVERRLDAGGAVTIRADAPAEVWLDGALRGTTPLAVTVPSGVHALQLRARGFLPYVTQVEVAAGVPREVSAKLERITAELSLSTVPPGAEVTANGEPLGTTPLSHARVFAGTVELGLRAPDHHSYRFNVALAPQEFRDLGTFRLEEPFGWLDARLPPGSLIALDGGLRHPPAPYERIALGEHQLEVFAPNYFAYAEKLAVADAQTVVLDPPLALNDRLPLRRALGYGLSGLGMGLGLVSIGLSTDHSTSDLVTPALLTGAVLVGAGVYCLVTSPRGDEAGWAEARTFQASDVTR